MYICLPIYPPWYILGTPTMVHPSIPGYTHAGPPCRCTARLPARTQDAALTRHVTELTVTDTGVTRLLPTRVLPDCYRHVWYSFLPARVVQPPTRIGGVTYIPASVV